MTVYVHFNPQTIGNLSSFNLSATKLKNITWNEPQLKDLKNLYFVGGIIFGNRTFNRANKSCRASCAR